MKERRRWNLTSKLLFLAVESCNALTQISATSAQLIPYVWKLKDILFNVAYAPYNMASCKQLMVHGISPERFYSLDQRSMHADHQVLPETI
jgi:hypothetical protein